MKIKITSRNFKIDVFKGFFVGAMLLFASSTLFSQVAVTNVFPTRVTTGSTVKVIGSGFTPAIAETIVLASISIGSRTYISSTEMSFVINRIEGDRNNPLQVDGSTTSYQIKYIQPTAHTLADNQSFFVKEIYTNWDFKDGFWRSDDHKSASEVDKPAASPDNKHELLGYMVNNGTYDIIYSTGVADDLLETKLMFSGILSQADIDAASVSAPTSGLKYYKKVYKAYSTNGVRGKIKSDNFIIAGDMIDGIDGTVVGAETPGQFNTLDEIRDNIKYLTILEAIISGKNGLELGIGVTNFKSDHEIQFFSGNGEPGGIMDYGAPDLLITQMADAQGAGGTDIYYYADDLGNVVGRPIKLTITEIPSTILAKWKVNLYTFPRNEDFGTATPNGRGTEFVDNKFRPIRMAAFKLEDFEINDLTSIGSINNINMLAGGTADIAFMAYNQDAFNIKGPVAKTILPQYVCRIDNDSEVTFKIKVGEGGNVGIEDYSVDGNIRGPKESDGPIEFKYQLWKIGDTDPLIPLPAIAPASLTIENVNAGKLGIYKLLIDNGQGSVIVPVELVQGGTPTFWNGTQWTSPYGDEVLEMEKSLIFSVDYNTDIEGVDILEGCNCIVRSDADVTIGVGKILKLYGNIVVEGVTDILDELGQVIGQTPAGTFTLKNNASLIQTKPVTVNENSGKIIVERIAKDLKQYDYVYWSSPVMGFEVNSIPGSARYEWDVIKGNTNGTYGNWVAPLGPLGSGVMVPGKGYIVRVPSSVPKDPPYDYILQNTFEGIPNNGDYNVLVKTTPLVATNVFDNQHWNLIGNPYPSAINPDKLLTDNEAVLDGVLQVWTHRTPANKDADNPFYENFGVKYSADDYLTYNLTSSTDPNFSGFIASGQGFMAKASSTANDKYVKFTNAMRFEDNEDAFDNSQFFRGTGDSNASNESTEKQLIWLALSDESKMATVAVVGYVKGATNDKDRLYDANSGSGDMRIYSILEDSDLLIQGRALPFEDSDKVPLGVEILKNGIYKIGIDHLKGSLMLNEAQGIYLEDTYTNVIHDLRNAPYGFTADAGDIKDRFVLRYTNKSLSVDDKPMSDTFVYVKNEQLYVKASKNITSIVVYDLTGKKLMDYKLDGHADKFNAQFQFPKGAYLTVIKLENSGSITKKVMN